jgi:hypothetical protein
MTGLSEWQRGVLDALAPGEDLELAVIGFVESELERKGPRVSAFEERRARVARWRDRHTRLVERVLDAFEDLERRKQGAPVGGRTYRLPEQADEGERVEHQLAEDIGNERAA